MIDLSFWKFFIADAPDKKLHKINLASIQGKNSPCLCQGLNGADAAELKRWH